MFFYIQVKNSNLQNVQFYNTYVLNVYIMI